MSNTSFRYALTSLLIIMFTQLCISKETFASHDKNPDTLRPITIDEVVITANRYEKALLNTGTSISVIRKKEIQMIPVSNFSNMLNYLPGLHSVSNDGMGLEPQVSIRGFYGGGEAEYLTVLIDGIPINDMESGLASWNQIPLNQVQKVELLRGASSTLYGDAAMGGVLNIRTQRENKQFTTVQANYGSYNTYSFGAAHGGMAGKGHYEIYVNNNATDGYREHSNWNTLNFGGKVKIPLSRRSTLAFSTYNQLLKSDAPGYLSDELIADDRKISQPYFQADGKDYQKYLANLMFTTLINKQADISVSLNYQHNYKEQIRTYGQYPNILIMSGESFYPIGIYDTTIYADTKKRDLRTDQADFDIRITSEIPELYGKITGGINVGYDGYDNEYYDIFRGFEYDYTNNYSPWDSLDTKGDGYRFTSSVYLNGEFELARPLTLIAGIRYDFLSDDFNASVPDTAINSTRSAVSPKLALTLSTGDYDNYKGSIFISYSRAFKAPTIDQLTDLKQLHYFVFIDAGPSYIPSPITAMPFSNANLKPQTSNNYEIGTYQFFKFSDKVNGEINVSAYLIDVKDEIDFNLQTQQYGNLINTQHTGFDIGIGLNVDKNWNGFFNYNFVDAKFSEGENKDNQIKGIPNSIYSSGISYAPERGFGATLIFTGAGQIYLDDENTETLEGYSIFNARANYKFKHASIFIDVNNILDSSYSSTGYALDGVKYLYPAMGRFIRAGVNFSF